MNMILRSLQETMTRKHKTWPEQIHEIPETWRDVKGGQQTHRPWTEEDRELKYTVETPGGRQLTQMNMTLQGKWN